jgi:hypothetical protein
MHSPSKAARHIKNAANRIETAARGLSTVSRPRRASAPELSQLDVMPRDTRPLQPFIALPAFSRGTLHPMSGKNLDDVFAQGYEAIQGGLVFKSDLLNVALKKAHAELSPSDFKMLFDFQRGLLEDEMGKGLGEKKLAIGSRANGVDDMAASLYGHSAQYFSPENLPKGFKLKFAEPELRRFVMASGLHREFFKSGQAKEKIEQETDGAHLSEVVINYMVDAYLMKHTMGTPYDPNISDVHIDDFSDETHIGAEKMSFNEVILLAQASQDDQAKLLKARVKKPNLYRQQLATVSTRLEAERVMLEAESKAQSSMPRVLEVKTSDNRSVDRFGFIKLENIL